MAVKRGPLQLSRRRRTLRHLAIFPVLVASLHAEPAQAIEKRLISDGGPGKAALTIKFGIDPESAANIGLDADSEVGWQRVVDKASEILWQVTEGQHYIERAIFSYGVLDSDVWVQYDSSGWGVADYQTRINFFLPESPDSEDSETATKSFAEILIHELGHYYYRQPDEYLSGGANEAGVCSDTLYSTTADSENACTSLRNDSCGGDVSCLREDICFGGTYHGAWCTEDEDSDVNTPDGSEDDIFRLYNQTGVFRVDDEGCEQLGGGTCYPSVSAPGERVGYCTGANLGQECNEHTDCGSGFCTALSDRNYVICAPLPATDQVCMMGNQARKRWCDSSTHQHVVPETWTFPRPGMSLSNETSVFANAIVSEIFDAPEGYDCWSMAKHEHPELGHEPGNLPDLDSFGSPPPATVDWNIDPEQLDVDGHVAIFVDTSGSMIEKFDSFNRPAWDYALDGAAYFYNDARESDLVQYAGMYSFDETAMPLPSNIPGEDFSLAPDGEISPDGKDFDRDAIKAQVEGGHYTNICSALNHGVSELGTISLPKHQRGIVLLTDGNSNVEGCNPSQLAAQICEDYGIAVHAISYGDANDSLVDALTTGGCGGSTVVAGRGDGTLSDGHTLQVAFAKMRHALNGLSSVLSEETSAFFSGGSPTRDRTFFVPDGTTELVVTWIGNAEQEDESGDIAFNNMGFSLIPPGAGQPFVPSVDSLREETRYRTIKLLNPVSGEWTMRSDSSQVHGNSKRQLKLSHLAYVRTPGLSASAWADQTTYRIGQPVQIKANLLFKSRFTNLDVSAVVSDGQGGFTFAMYDDGLHGDSSPNDGIYGVSFTPTQQTGFEDATYQVDVILKGGAGEPLAVSEREPVFPNTSLPIPPSLSSGVELVAETQFGLVAPNSPEEPSVSFNGPTTIAPVTGVSQSATVTLNRIYVTDQFTSLSLGEGVSIKNLVTQCLDCEGDPPETAQVSQFQLTFDVEVEEGASLGNRDLTVEANGERWVLENAIEIVCGPGGNPGPQFGSLSHETISICNPEEELVDLTAPSPSPVCGNSLTQLSAQVTISNGVRLESPISADQNHRVLLPAGDHRVEWTAVDSAGNTSKQFQTITLAEPSTTGACCGTSLITLGTEYDDDIIVYECEPVCVLGLGGDDWIDGSHYGGRIEGGPGADIIAGYSKETTYLGNAGDDCIFYGYGDEEVYGGAGNDLLVADVWPVSSTASIYGGEGDDDIFGNELDETIVPGAGADVVDAGPEMIPSSSTRCAS